LFTTRNRPPRAAAVLLALGVWISAAGSGCNGNVAGSNTSNDGGTPPPGSPAEAGEGGSMSGCASNADCPIGNRCNQVHGASGVCCPGLGCFPNCPNGVLKDAKGCETCQCAPSPDGASPGHDAGSAGPDSSGTVPDGSGIGPDGGGAGSGACMTSADCAAGDVCGFPQADGCSAKGSCFPAPGAVCRAYSPGCACDGTEISVVCTGLPSGYLSKPLRHTGVCTSAADAGD
jgi:hypothetical protein